MKIIDERGRLFGKVSVIDLAVILIILVMAAAYYFRTNAGKDGAEISSSVEVRYEMTVREVRQTTVDLLRVGDPVYDEHGVNMGVIETVSHAPALIKSALTDGSYVDSTSEGRFDVTMTLKANCAVADGHIFAERKTELSIGAQIPILTKYIKTSAWITNIEQY
jgi:hypothetical protein